LGTTNDISERNLILAFKKIASSDSYQKIMDCFETHKPQHDALNPFADIFASLAPRA
jgi:hypothetical protein